MGTLPQRVVVTGLGVVSPVGVGRGAFFEALEAGRSGIRPVTLFDTSGLRPKLAGEVSPFEPKDVLGPKGLRLLDRTTRLALCASQLALRDAGYADGETPDPDETGVALGSTMGSFSSRGDFFRELFVHGPRALNPALFPNTVVNSPASQVSIRFGVRGFNATLASGFTSALDAIDYAAGFIRMGRAQAALAGGAEELSQGGYWALYRAGLLSGTRADSREGAAPFDLRRNGLVAGEGAVIVLLEALEHARRRRAVILAEYSGGGSAGDESAHQAYSRRGSGSRRAIRRALETAGVSGRDVGFVAAGAHGSLLGDAMEGRVLHELLCGATRGPLPASAVKSFVGEAISAGAGFQVAAALFALTRGLLPPTIGVEQADPRCRIDCLPGRGREALVDHVLVHAFGPTCQSSAAVMSRFPG